MTITRDHVSDLAEKASSDYPRSGKTSPSAAAATSASDVGPAAAAVAAASRNAEGARDSNEVPVVTLATLRSLPENEEVTLYLDVVPGAAAPARAKPPNKAAHVQIQRPSKKGAPRGSEFDKFLKRPCPDLGGLLHTLERKMTPRPTGQRQRLQMKPDAEEVVATVSQCVIVRKVSSCDEGKGGGGRRVGRGGGCGITGKFPSVSTPPLPPMPPPAAPPKSAASSKVDATIDACLLGESQIGGEAVHCFSIFLLLLGRMVILNAMVTTFWFICSVVSLSILIGCCVKLAFIRSYPT